MVVEWGAQVQLQANLNDLFGTYLVAINGKTHWIQVQSIFALFIIMEEPFKVDILQETLGSHGVAKVHAKVHLDTLHREAVLSRILGWLRGNLSGRCWRSRRHTRAVGNCLRDRSSLIRLGAKARGDGRDGGRGGRRLGIRCVFGSRCGTGVEVGG